MPRPFPLPVFDRSGYINRVTIDGELEYRIPSAYWPVHQGRHGDSGLKILYTMTYALVLYPHHM